MNSFGAKSLEHLLDFKWLNNTVPHVPNDTNDCPTTSAGHINQFYRNDSSNPQLQDHLNQFNNENLMCQQNNSVNNLNYQHLKNKFVKHYPFRQPYQLQLNNHKPLIYDTITANFCAATSSSTTAPNRTTPGAVDPPPKAANTNNTPMKRIITSDGTIVLQKNSAKATKRLPCILCNKTFSGPGYLLQHQSQKHSDVPLEMYEKLEMKSNCEAS